MQRMPSSLRFRLRRRFQSVECHQNVKTSFAFDFTVDTSIKAANRCEYQVVRFKSRFSPQYLVFITFCHSLIFLLISRKWNLQNFQSICVWKTLSLAHKIYCRNFQSSVPHADKLRFVAKG